MIERKGSGKTTIVERKWTLLALYCIAAAPSCPMLFAFCTKGPTLFGRSERRRARNFRTTAVRSAAVRQSYSMRSDDAVRPPLLYCEEIRCSSAFFCPAAEWSNAIRPAPGITCYTYTYAEDPTMFRVAFCSTRPTLLDHCCSTAKRISCCSDNAQQRRTIAP